MLTDVQVHCIDAAKGLASLPKHSVHCIITSPPYWSCRDYNRVSGQIGMEPTWMEYIYHLICVFKEAWNALTRDGSLWVNLGDVFAQRTAKGFNPLMPPKTRMALPERFRAAMELPWLRCPQCGFSDHGMQWGQVPPVGIWGLPAWICPVCLVIVEPEVLQKGWLYRQGIIWAKPNAMFDPARDRFTPSHEFLFHFTKQQKYYFNLDAVREPHVTKGHHDSKRVRRGVNATAKIGDATAWAGGRERMRAVNTSSREHGRYVGHPLGRAPRDVWLIPTAQYKGKHFAVFPERLCERPIMASCPPGGTVCDPFCGTGTALYVALRLGRNAIGFDLDPQSVHQARIRCSPISFQFTEIERKGPKQMTIDDFLEQSAAMGDPLTPEDLEPVDDYTEDAEQVAWELAMDEAVHGHE